MNPISVEEFERLHPAMLGAIRKAVREELELSLADGDSEDGSRDFKRTVLSSSSVQHTLDKHRMSRLIVVPQCRETVIMFSLSSLVLAMKVLLLRSPGFIPFRISSISLNCSTRKSGAPGSTTPSILRKLLSISPPFMLGLNITSICEGAIKNPRRIQ